MKGKTLAKILIIALAAGAVAAFFAFDMSQYLTLERLKTERMTFQAWYESHKTASIAVYMLIYVVMTAASLPAAGILTLAGGALFGFWIGTLAVSFASAIGGTLAFMISRFILRDYVQRRFGGKLGAINRGMERDGSLYLFSIRLVPVFPFFMVNMLMGLTHIRISSFYTASQLGMIPATMVFVNAGTQLAQLDSVSGILSPGMLLSFALLGIFPIVVKKILNFIKAKKMVSRYKRPKKFDYNLAVIGAGSAGLVSAYVAAMVKARVLLIEKGRPGGDCLNTGCVPSKALVRSAKFLSHAKRAREFGFRKVHVDFDFKDVIDRAKTIIKKIEPHDSFERYEKLGVDCVSGEAEIVSPYEIRVNGGITTARNIIIATGAGPFVPKIPGLDKIDFLTSDNLLDLKKLPERLTILGGGPIGCEMAQIFARLGSRVTQVQRGARIMPREDPEISELIRERFESEGISVLTGHSAREVVTENGRSLLVCDFREKEVRIEFDKILVAVGRAPHSRGFGLEGLGVAVSENGTVETDELMKTNFPNIFCAGDVAGPWQFTHTAAHQAWYASVNALFGGLKTFKADYSVIPWATYTDPEVARVGLSETDARAKNVEYEVTRYDIDDLDRAITDSEACGFIKVLTQPGRDKILGVTVVASHAGDMIAEYILAMKHGLGLKKILGTIHIYPTMAEANKFVAGAWGRAHMPHKLLKWAEKYHSWLR